LIWPLGTVINRYPTDPKPDAEPSPAVIEAMTGAPVLGRLPEHLGVDVEAGRLEAVADLVDESSRPGADSGADIEEIGGCQ